MPLDSRVMSNHDSSMMQIDSFSFRLFFTILALFCLSGLVNAEKSEKTYSDSQYTFVYPSGWGMEKSESGPILKGPGGINIAVVETPPTEKSPKQFAEDNLREQSKKGAKFTITKQNEYKTASAGYPVFLIGFMDGEDESNLHFVKLPDNRIIVFSLSKDDKFTPDEVKTGQAVIDSIRFVR